MKILGHRLVFIFLAFVVFPAFSQPGEWSYIGPNPYYFGGGPGYFSDITFADSLHGFTTDGFNSRILRTVDGGLTWQFKPASITSLQAQFITPELGWIANRYALAKTTNGGDSWVNQLDTTGMAQHNADIRGIYFVDSLTGFVSGYYYIGKTLDGGSTWSNITPLGIDSMWTTTFFLNADTGWAFSMDSTMAKTMDGGQTWAKQTDFGVANNWGIAGGHFYSANTGVVINESGAVSKTTDGGNTWTQLSGMPDNVNGSVKFGAGGLVYGFAGTLKLALSTDSGLTWRQMTAPVGVSAYFLSPTIGFTTAYQVYKTENGGTTWQTDLPQYPQAAYPISDIDWVTNTHAIAVTIGGYPLESFDNGINWTDNSNLYIGFVQSINSQCYFRNDGNHDVERYENGVMTYSLPNQYSFLYAQSRDSFVICYRGSYDSILVLRTIDGGNSWSTIFATKATDGIYSGEWGDGVSSPDRYARFMSWNIGVVAYISDSMASREFVTLDGGANWTNVPANKLDRIESTKISPMGNLICLRQGVATLKGSLWKWDSSNSQWQFVSLTNLDPMVYQGADIGWSPDSILWSYKDIPNWGNFFTYSLDEGNTWHLYPLRINGITMLKQLSNGKFICGTGHGDLLVYDGQQYNCRIKGNVFYDFNRNGIFDGYDIEATSSLVGIQPTGLNLFTGADGNYITSIDSGSYSISTDAMPNYKAVPGSIPVTLNSQTYVSANNNFVLQPIDTSRRDLYLGVIDGFESAPGFEHTTYIAYSNVGVQPIQPQLIVVLDSELTFTSALPNITSQRGDTLFWDLPVIDPLRSKHVRLTTTLSASAQLGQFIKIKSAINPVAGDYTPQDNIDSTSFEVLGSFDPNFKEVSPKEIASNQTLYQPELRYTIHFQNTGTAAAHFVVVKDKLPESLNISTLKILASSAPCDFYMEDGNVAVFRFNNINLPDSGADMEGSQGFVSFIITAKAQQLDGNAIYNSADIYFDYNQPVITNNAKITLDDPLTEMKTVFNDELNIKIFPNPANDIVNVESGSDFVATLFDVWGRPLFESKSLNSRLSLNVGNFSAGMYYLQVLQNGKRHGYSVAVITH